MLSGFFRRRPIAAQLVFALGFAFLTRSWQFGNPVIQVDEQFYLVTGDRLLRGALPYVDIWDRKPVGIFLLYAAIRLLGGEGIYQYQIVATLFAGMTAFLIAVMALRFTNARGAALGGAAYLVWLIVFDGSGGQTPVFYNALMAGAAAATLAATAPNASAHSLIRNGSIAMLLAGLALQIKYSAVFEGIFFGLALLRQAYLSRLSKAAVFGCGAGWVSLALLPTGVALGWYAWLGQVDAFVYANFVSIFERGAWPAGPLLGRLGTLFGFSSPLLLCAWAEWTMNSQPREPQSAHARRFALAWLGSALLGLLAFGTYFTHYFLPVLVPLTLVAARLLGDREAGIALTADGGVRRVRLASVLAICGVALIAISVPKRLNHRGDGEDVRAVAAAVRQNLNGCLLVYDGEPILYEMTGACLATTRAFPNHLNEAVEADAIGVDPIAETARILASGRTDIIVASDRPNPHHNRETLALVEEALRTNYRPVFRVTIGSRDRIVYKRLATSLATAPSPRAPS